MASVLTDQAAGKSAPLAPVPITTAAFVQAAPTLFTPSAGNLSCFLPTQDGSADAFGSATVVNPYERFRAHVVFSCKTGTTTNLTLNLVLVDSAGTVTIIATTGAKAVNTTTSGGRLSAEFLIDPNAAVIAGELDGYVGASLVTLATLTNSPAVVWNNSTPAKLQVSALLSVADATSVLTIDELTLERL